jgi:hypothetical protein
MLGEKSVLDSLAAKREALIAESDANRTELARDWETLKTEAARAVKPVQKVRHYLSMGYRAVSALLAVRKAWSQSHDANGKRNWTATLLQTARIGLSLWPAFRPAAR